MEKINKNQLTKRVLKTMEECRDPKVLERLQTIFDRLNDNSSLEKNGLIQRLKNAIYSWNSKYINEEEIENVRISIKELEEIVSTSILTEKVFQNRNFEDFQSDLEIEINNFLDLHFGVVFNEQDNSLKRYDIEFTDDMKMAAYNEVLKQMQHRYIEGDIYVRDLIIETKDKYMQMSNSILSKCKDMEIQPYYGSKEFMEHRIVDIIKGITRLLEYPKFEGRKDMSEDLQYLQQMYADYKGCSINMNSIEEQKSYYEQLEEFYKKALSIEDRLSKDVEQVWKDRMKEKNSTEGEMAYFAHVLTRGEFNPNDMTKVCVAYITEKTLALPYGDYGFIYDMDMENILQMSSTDAGSWKINKKDFIERKLPTNYQFTEPIDEDGNRIFFEYPPTVSKLLLPDDVELETINNTIKSNGEMLNYDKFMPINETVIINKNKKMMPKAVFVRTYGEEENSEKVKKAKLLSEKLGIELKIFDKAKLREILGLQPLTLGEQNKLSKGSQIYND